MKRISTYIATLILALAGSSCSDYLDKEYDASLSEKKVFNNQNLTREFLANIYTNLPDGAGCHCRTTVHGCFTRLYDG